MSRLEKTVTSIVDLFEEYAGTDDKKRTLSMKELGEMIQKEMSSPEFEGKIHQDDLQTAMDVLDKNKDGEIKFHEFSRCVALLAKGLWKQKRGRGGKKGKGDDGDD